MIEFTSRGLYNVPDAARLLHVSQPTILRWAFGYRRKGVAYQPITSTEVPPLVAGRRAITFLDLIQLLSTREFLKAGAPWRMIRESYDRAKVSLGTPYPFAQDHWFADQAGIYHRGVDEDEHGPLTEMSSSGLQATLQEALKQYLTQIDFEAEGQARRWFPLGRSQPIAKSTPSAAFTRPLPVPQTAKCSGPSPPRRAINVSVVDEGAPVVLSPVSCLKPRDGLLGSGPTSHGARSSGNVGLGGNSLLFYLRKRAHRRTFSCPGRTRLP